MIKQVPIARILAELELIAEYGAECSIPAIGEINPNVTIYAALEASGMLHSFAAYEDEKMVGFANILTPILPHYSKRVGTVESQFVMPSQRGRGIGKALESALAEHAKNAGCVGILSSAPDDSELESILDKNPDYERTNAVFYRRLV